MGFIQDDGTSFMSAYLMSLASNLPYGQQAAPSVTIYDLGGTLCVPGGSALRAPAPHDTAFTGPRFGGISYEQWASSLAAFYDLGVWCKPGWGTCFINNPTLRLKIEEFSLLARLEHLKSQPNHPKRMAGSKNKCIFYSTYVGIFCDPSIEFIVNGH
jgi:hypothetical protein